jgi:hypothetical protein
MRHEAASINWRGLRFAAQMFAPPVTPAPNSGLPAVLVTHGWSGFQDANDVVLAAYDARAQWRKIDGSSSSVCGSSLGAYLAALLGSRRAPANLSLRVPANYPDEIFDRTALAAYVTGAQAKLWRSIALPPTGTRALQALIRFRGHLQIIEAAHDEVIPDHCQLPQRGRPGRQPQPRGAGRCDTCDL